jgi:hypothetical protein
MFCEWKNFQQVQEIETKGNHLNEQSERRKKGNIVKCVVDK